MLRLAIACFVALVALSGCDRDVVVRIGEALNRPRAPTGHVKYVNVRVLIDGHDCIVDTRQMGCDVVAAHLKDDRHTALSESVLVAPDGTGTAAIARAHEVRSHLEAAGYSDVLIIGFLTSPDHPNPDP